MVVEYQKNHIQSVRDVKNQIYTSVWYHQDQRKSVRNGKLVKLGNAIIQDLIEDVGVNRILLHITALLESVRDMRDLERSNVNHENHCQNVEEEKQKEHIIVSIQSAGNIKLQGRDAQAVVNLQYVNVE